MVLVLQLQTIQTILLLQVMQQDSIETIFNVGSGEGIFKDVTGTTANLKTLIAGDGITIIIN